MWFGIYSIWKLTWLLTEYKQAANSRNELRVQASGFSSTKNAKIAASSVAKKHNQVFEYKWSGQALEIGTCWKVED